METRNWESLETHSLLSNCSLLRSQSSTKIATRHLENPNSKTSGVATEATVGRSEVVAEETTEVISVDEEATTCPTVAILATSEVEADKIKMAVVSTITETMVGRTIWTEWTKTTIINLKTGIKTPLSSSNNSSNSSSKHKIRSWDRTTRLFCVDISKSVSS